MGIFSSLELASSSHSIELKLLQKHKTFESQAFTVMNSGKSKKLHYILNKLLVKQKLEAHFN
jgi:hypothetical protein